MSLSYTSKFFYNNLFKLLGILLIIKMELSDLHKRLNQHLENQKKEWKSFIYSQEAGFYQGFDKIELKGCRPSEERFKIYDLGNFLSKDKTALDIGCNCGFFSLCISGFLKSIDGVEINPFLIAIANDTKEFLNINNAFFQATSFEDFKPNKRYDVIFSLANDSTIDGNTKFNFFEYVSKIISLLQPSGLLVFESQAPDAFRPERFKPKLEHLKKHFDVLVDKKVPSNYPYNVKERFFLILKKKN